MMEIGNYGSNCIDLTRNEIGEQPEPLNQPLNQHPLDWVPVDHCITPKEIFESSHGLLPKFRYGLRRVQYYYDINGMMTIDKWVIPVQVRLINSPTSITQQRIGLSRSSDIQCIHVSPTYDYPGEWVDGEIQIKMKDYTSFDTYNGHIMNHLAADFTLVGFRLYKRWNEAYVKEEKNVDTFRPHDIQKELDNQWEGFIDQRWYDFFCSYLMKSSLSKKQMHSAYTSFMKEWQAYPITNNMVSALSNKAGQHGGLGVDKDTDKDIDNVVVKNIVDKNTSDVTGDMTSDMVGEMVDDMATVVVVDNVQYDEVQEHPIRKKSPVLRKRNSSEREKQYEERWSHQKYQQISPKSSKTTSSGRFIVQREHINKQRRVINNNYNYTHNHNYNSYGYTRKYSK